ncbi:MAG: uridine diphosphate-N-acetylglucosamine-binding protein YvcK [Anaerolineae bacterium]|nr:uridine diphosphate-N-acetylglucosamine-binding protein YvcK [Anaerolineae bacterium]NIN96637.1 uridine diphosphate-N-acetylglucosamine-binding protein YvcK [Anaerolineae bacterium]NIQ79670.1 uridine diphosphate-N-acetylglucosamine-binding protein YvcK [Anaerolineae bacterium]
MRFRPKFGSTLKWLIPGMGVKRWLLLLFGGITIVSLGAGYVLVEVYRTWTFPAIFYYLTLQFIPRAWRGLLFGTVGIAAIVFAIFQLNRSLLSAFLSPGQSSLADIIYNHRQRTRGPKVVAIGGGTGLSALLRGLKEHTDKITAIVTVADDGGSSGRLRRDLGLLPPGDFRSCIAALADDESLTARLFQYRFGEGKGLNGHSFGNLFIAAMAAVTGNFERAILESSHVLNIRGRIVPSTLENVTLWADLREDEQEEGPDRVAGESQISKSGRPIERVFLEPDKVPGYPGAIKAILEADLITAGPGSLFTSVLPNLLVPGIASAIRASPAMKVYISNIATEKGETDGYTLDDHLRELEEHVGEGLFTYVLANDNLNVQFPRHLKVDVVTPATKRSDSYEFVTADLVDLENPWQHDPQKLSEALMDLYWRVSAKTTAD